MTSRRPRLALVAALLAGGAACSSWHGRGFETLESEHFLVSAPAGTFAAGRLAEIARVREEALRRVAAIFGVEVPSGLTLTLYPDERTKREATGHAGLGWGEDGKIVEVHNREIQLDPYHELAHVVGGLVGRPPAFLDEGFAVYLAETQGADALALLGRPRVSIREAGCELVTSGEALSLEALFDFTDLGSEASRGPISYPQSASVVRFLVEAYGRDRLLLAYRRLESPERADLRAANRTELARLYGRSLQELEVEWKASACAARPGPESLERDSGRRSDRGGMGSLGSGGAPPPGEAGAAGCRLRRAGGYDRSDSHDSGQGTGRGDLA